MSLGLVVRVRDRGIEERTKRLDHVSGQPAMEESDVGCCCNFAVSLCLGDAQGGSLVLVVGSYTLLHLIMHFLGQLQTSPQLAHKGLVIGIPTTISSGLAPMDLFLLKCS